MIRHTKSKYGFTLLEVLISITILALMTVMISRLFSGSSRAVEQGQGQALLDETARLVLDYIEQDISQALIRTNVAFRIQSQVDLNDSIYLISTGIRRQLETIPRDTAPMRIQTAQAPTNPSWNRHIEIQSPDDSASNIKNLIEHSDYYFSNPDQTTSDFFLIHNQTSEMALQNPLYTQPLEQELENHAVLTFMKFSANGDSNSNNSNSTGQPNFADMPRFIDVTIGLIFSTDLQIAIRRNSLNHVENNEVIYTRRIFMRNTGTESLIF